MEADSFMDLKSIIVNRLGAVRNLMETADGVGCSGAVVVDKNGEKVLPDQRTSIVIQAAIRENVRQLGLEWRQLEGIYLGDVGKRKMKFSEGEAQTRRDVLENLEREIDVIKKDQRDWYIKDLGGGPGHGIGAGRVKNIEDSELFVGIAKNANERGEGAGFHHSRAESVAQGRISPGGGYHRLESDEEDGDFLVNPEAKMRNDRNKQLDSRINSRINVDVNAFFDESGGWDSQGGVSITSHQREKLLTLHQREEAFDDTIASIGLGVEDLRVLAERQNEEVKMQNLMLEDMSLRMDEVSEGWGVGFISHMLDEKLF